MEEYTLTANIFAFGFPVMTFPKGIGDAFDSLIKKIPNGKERSYFGISYFNTQNQIVYIAAAEEVVAGEAEKFGYERYTINQGKYLCVSVLNWREKTDVIKDVFHIMMQNEQIDPAKPCIEWYKDDHEMLCLVKMTASKNAQ